MSIVCLFWDQGFHRLNGNENILKLAHSVDGNRKGNIVCENFGQLQNSIPCPVALEHNEL